MQAIVIWPLFVYRKISDKHVQRKGGDKFLDFYFTLILTKVIISVY